MKCYVNGVDTASIDLELVEWYIDPLPQVRDFSVEIAGRDGELDFGSSFSTRSIQLVFFITDNTNLGYYDKVAAASALFNPMKGEQIISFDGELSGKRYLARAAGTIPISKGSEVRTLSIPLKMSWPFPESIQDTSAKEYGQGFEYGQSLEYTLHSAQVTATGQEIDIMHDGTYKVAPLIRVTGSFTNLSLSDGRSTFTYTGTTVVGDIIEIDCKAYTVTKNGVNAYAHSNGVFFLLESGTTTFKVTGSGLNCKIEFIFRHTYLY